MIDDMYRVMTRISNLQKRFGLVKPVQIEKRHNQAVIPQQQNFKVKVEQAVKTTGNQGTIEGAIKKYAAINRVPEALVRSVIEAESSFNPQAVSPKGARGLMQLMPSVISDKNVSKPFDIDENIRGGTSLLKDLLNRYNGDYRKALAAYNAGPVTVDRANGVPNITETQQYVDKVLQLYMKQK